MRVPNVSILLATVCLVTAADSQKRVPSGFTGVRGKKSETYDGLRGFEDDAGEHQGLEVAGDGVAEKRAPSGFMGVRGKKPSELQWDGAQDYGNKRAPSGFLGMRGKKELDFDEFEKRAPSGFMGMRGKKEFDPQNDYQLGPAYDPFMYHTKRGPSGFMGMRGKKDYGSNPEEDKRAPSSGFFGMRGKKQPGRSSFFGMRGKKYPYEFRGKFVGVRGKKFAEAPLGSYEEYEANDRINGVEDYPSLNQLMLLLTETEGYNPDRETASIGQDYSVN